ncbi:MAG TPA: hypothetical protein VFT68_19315 [Lapillicoccus sp.]|nr:hypothetical protein [Lapillicoccus sp.]
MSESPPPPAGEGAFGAPPGAAQWPQPAPPPAYPSATAGPPGYPPPQGQPYPAAYPQPSGYAPPYPPQYAGYAPAQTSPFPVSTFVLLIVSVISLIATGIIGIPSAIVSVVAWRRNAADPAACRKLTTTGWIVYAVNFVIALPLLIWFYVWALSNQ